MHSAVSSKGKVLVTGIAMHHIYCESKKAFILDRAQELKLRGFYVFGKPGRVVVEGETDSVLRYERDLRCLRWQKIQVMGRASYDERRLVGSSAGTLQECLNEDELFRRLAGAQLDDIVTTLKRPFGAPRTL